MSSFIKGDAKNAGLDIFYNDIVYIKTNMVVTCPVLPLTVFHQNLHHDLVDKNPARPCLLQDAQMVGWDTLVSAINISHKRKLGSPLRTLVLPIR